MSDESRLLSNVAANIRRERLRRALNQEDFARIVGLHRTYVGEIERGEQNLTLRSVERIAERLGVEAVSLLAPLPID